MKNLNSFRFLQKALEHEIARHIAVLEGGGRDRAGDAAVGRRRGPHGRACARRRTRTTTATSPSPTSPPLELDPAWIEQQRAALPELPEARRQRFVAEYGLPAYDAGWLTQSAGARGLLRGDRARCRATPRLSSNWIMGELARLINERGDGVRDAADRPPRGWPS